MQISYIADILVSRRGRLVTCSSSNAVRLWSVVNVGEIKHAAQHSGNSSALGVTMEDEMSLDAPASSASFDDTLEMVNGRVFQLLCLTVYYYYYYLR